MDGQLYKVEAKVDGSWITLVTNVTEPEGHIFINNFVGSSINATNMRVIQQD